MWKKLKKGYPFVKGYWKSDSGKYLTVKKHSAIGKGKFYSPASYAVALNHNFDRPLRTFKTQAQANKFARSYMKK